MKSRRYRGPDVSTWLFARLPAPVPAWLVGAALAGTVACDAGTRVDVRTTLPEALRVEVETAFESAHPGIDVRFSEAATGESLDALRSDGTDFDVWWGAPALALERAGDAGLLAPYEPDWDGRGRSISVAAESDAWHPVLATPFVFAFDRTTVALAAAPTDWIDVFHHSWYQEVRVPDPTGTDAGAWLAGSMIVEALRDDDDVNRGFDWLERLHDQVDLYGREPGEMVRALRRGDALLAIMTRADAETARTAGAPWLHYRIPTSGTPELTLGVGIVAGTDAPEAARAFVDFLGTDAVATASKVHTHREPTVGTVDRSRLPPDFELELSWRAYAPAFDTLAAELDGWIARWEAEIALR